MRPLPLFTFCLLLLASCAQKPSNNCPEHGLSARTMTEMPIKGDRAVTIVEGGANALKDLFSSLLGKAVSGDLQTIDLVHTPWDVDPVILSSEAIKARLFHVDTQYVESPQPPHNLVMQVVTDSFQLSEAFSIRPYERWDIDSLSISKQVLGYALVAESTDRISGEVRGTMPLFTVTCGEKQGEPSKLATVRYLQQVNRATASNAPYNWFAQNLEVSVREKLFGTLIAKAEKGTLQAYPGPSTDGLLGKEALMASITFTDSMWVESPEPPYALEKVAVTSTLDFSDIVAIECVQDILMYANGTITIDLKWYAPVVGTTDKYGNLTTTRTLFWVKN
jgi:hypothetical protein